MSERVTIVDVTPRDGLQNEPKLVSTEDKLLLIEKLAHAGIPRIQATSFVHPAWVPQMADAEKIAAALRRFPGVTFSALVPNVKGYDRAVAAGFRHLEFVMSTSESFNSKNLNCSKKESLGVLEQTTRKAASDGVTLRVDVSTCFHCPFEGRVSSRAVADVARAIRDIGPWRITICDTDGMAFPSQVKETTELLVREVGLSRADIGLHVHDTYGRGLANAFAGLESGIREFDSCTAGLGGCPYCPGASGNLATEDLADLLDGMGFETGVDLDKLLDAAEFATRFSSRPYQGHLLRARRTRACELTSTN